MKINRPLIDLETGSGTKALSFSNVMVKYQNTMSQEGLLNVAVKTEKPTTF